MHSLDDDLQLALDVSDRAAQLALEHFEPGVPTASKADGTLVTEADRAVERLIRARLSEARPADAVLGEEFGRLGASSNRCEPNCERSGPDCSTWPRSRSSTESRDR